MSEMDKLEQYLKEKGTEYHRGRLLDEETEKFMQEKYGEDTGEQIIVMKNGRKVWDAICGDHSYGGKQGLLEIMGKPVVNKAVDREGVVGWLTADDVIKRVEEGERRGKI